MSERALSLKQAFNCEIAAEPRCRCRCNGAAHGRRRTFVELWSDDPATLHTIAQDMDVLPPEDPHYIAIKPAHPLGPMRLVKKTEERRGYNGYSRGRVTLTLECGHRIHRKSSRRVPKQLHCKECAGVGTKPAVCQKCGIELSKHTTGIMRGEVTYYCLQVPRGASRTVRTSPGRRRSGSRTSGKSIPAGKGTFPLVRRPARPRRSPARRKK
jgi:hypothetical protein